MTTASEPTTLDRRAWRANWLLSTVWLVFMAFPLLSLWWSASLSDTRKIGATVVAGVFGIVYALAFRRTTLHEVYGEAPGRFDLTPERSLAALVALNVVAFGLGSWAMLGLAPFIVAYAILNVSWRWALTVAAVAHIVVIGLPMAGGVYSDLWPITPAVATATLATGLGRRTEERAAERTMWRTQLLLSEDRNRVARDVHDVLGHSLTAVVLKAELADKLLARVSPGSAADQETLDRCRSELDELKSLSRRSLAEIRSTVGGLRNPDLADEIAAARTVLADAGVACTTVGDVTAVPPHARGPMAWVVRESVTNVVRHAHADHCTISLAPTHGTWLRIDDDGVGPDGIEEGNGLTGLRERLQPLDVDLVVASGPTAGTRLEIRHG